METPVQVPHPGSRTPAVSYDAHLVEQAVLCALAEVSPTDVARFRGERDPIYELADREERELRFQELHGRWFLALGLQQPIERALGERPILGERARGCHVLAAASPSDEAADLFADRPQPLIVIRLRPQSVARPQGLLPLLRHELTHVADMLEPGFGYQRELPALEGGPAADSLRRDRYRVVWDATIDGRLCRLGWLPTEARERRRQEFARAFPMLGPHLEAVFARWFDEPYPTHHAIAAFIADPARGLDTGREDTGAFDGRCPLCRFPTLPRNLVFLRPLDHAARIVAQAHRGWEPAMGLCRQCADLYEARVGA